MNSTLEQPHSVNTNLNELFEEEGYIIIDQAFPKEDLIAFKKSLQQAINQQFKRATNLNCSNQLPFTDIDTGLKALRYLDPLHISMVQMTISRTPEFYRLASNPKVAQIVKNLLGLPVDGLLYEISNGIVFTTPRDEDNKHDSNLNLNWHRDTFYTIPGSRFVQMWGPVLHDSTDEIGTLRVCPGSHKAGIGRQRYNPEANFNHRYTVDPSEISQYKPRSISLKLGQLMIFDGRLIHGSGKNNSEYVRCSILGLYHDATCEAFKPTAIEYKYLEKTPEKYFYEKFGDERIRSILNEQAAFPQHFD